ncbi:hypothetical protein ABAC460_06310 [Asticcacaulis sp. AC460]|nr:hypothetical protein ABAC460_06310 [Asticcacaulis sp. AC460]
MGACFRHWRPSFANGASRLVPSFLTYHSAPLLRWQVLASLPLIGLALGVIGPFGSYTGMTLGERLAHFALCVSVIGTGSLVISYAVARRWFQGYWPLWASLCVDVALAVPGAVVVYLSLAVFVPAVAGQIDPVSLVWQNLIMTLIFRAVSLALSWERIRDGGQVDAPPVVDGTAEFRSRLPRELRAQPVLALSSEDHYLRVHTPKGEALIHMTMAQAQALLPGGFQIHRSHWVAGEAIRKTAGDKVELVTGLSLPLSRHRRKAFDAWLESVTPA